MANIRTLGELKSGKGGDSGQSSDEDSNERQGFYVGGSERSGQQVLGPPRDGNNVQRLFDAVQRAGAEVVSPEEAAKLERSQQASAQQGGVYRLGESAAAPSEPIRPPEERTARVRVIFWQDGFSVDDGPLRALDDPESRPFLESLKRGRIPPELEAKYRNRVVDLQMERRPSPYVKPKPKPFGGSGSRLGSIVPTVVSDTPSSSGIPKKVEIDEAKKLLEEAEKSIGLREGEPTGRIQIRLPSSERLIAVFNPSHTVEDVRSFIVTALPDFAFQPFQLYTTYPNKVIEDETQTVKDVGILNAVVVLKLV